MADDDRYSKIPEELKKLKNWLLYKIEKIRNKDGIEHDTKVPYSAITGRKTDATNPENWVDFEVALAALKRKSSYAGPGFGICEGFTFTDFDHCVNLSTQASTLRRQNFTASRSNPLFAVRA